MNLTESQAKQYGNNRKKHTTNWKRWMAFPAVIFNMIPSHKWARALKTVVNAIGTKPEQTANCNKWLIQGWQASTQTFK